MDENKLQEILRLHKLWLGNDDQGKRAYLQGAYLQGAEGIISFGPIGESRRIGFAYYYKETRIQLGCFNGNLKETVKAIQEKYGKKSTYEAVIRACVAELEKGLE